MTGELEGNPIAMHYLASTRANTHRLSNKKSFGAYTCLTDGETVQESVEPSSLVKAAGSDYVQSSDNKIFSFSLVLSYQSWSVFGLSQPFLYPLTFLYMHLCCT